MDKHSSVGKQKFLTEKDNGMDKHNSVDKQKFLTEKVFQGTSSSITDSILLIFIITTKIKQLKNEIKWNLSYLSCKCVECKISHIISIILF